MAGYASQAPTALASSRPSPAANSNPSSDYINGHGTLPDAPAPNAAPTASTGKKGKSKKTTDPNETGKLLAAKINQLELDAAGEKDQEAEIGGYTFTQESKETVLASMKEHDLPQDMIAEVARALDLGPEATRSGQGLPSLKTIETLVAKFSLHIPNLNQARAHENLFARPLPMNSMDRQKLTEMPLGLIADIEREVKKATRDLTNLLTGMETPLSRLEEVQKRYTGLLADMKRMERDNTKNKKRADLLQKEKDQGRSELSKTNSMKEKLEKLCRELQRDNKKLKDEQKKIEDSERRSRDEFSDRTSNLYWVIDDTMGQAENPEGQKINVEQDEMFRQKFKSFTEQYELRELHFHALMRTKECEVQLSLARAEEQRRRAEDESKKSRTLNSQVSTFSQTETELRSQLNIYVEKFKQAGLSSPSLLAAISLCLRLLSHSDSNMPPANMLVFPDLTCIMMAAGGPMVEETLNNSNELFLTFRKEMEEMSKKTKRLEKENLNLTRKHDLTNRNILEMAEERTKVNKEMETLRKKNNTLESVIRRMQDQGRAPAAAGALEGDEEGTESDYEDDYDEEEGSEEGEYDDDTEEEALQAQVGALPTFGPEPPPPPSSQAQVNGKVNGEINGATTAKSIVV